MYTDPSGMRERLAFGDFERAGEALLAHEGLDPGGMLVRDETREAAEEGDPLAPDRRSIFGYDLGQSPDPLAVLEAVFSSDAAEPDYARIEDLVRFVHDTPAGPAYAAGFSARVDVDQFLDWMTGHVLIGDIDAYGDDYHLYLDLDDPGARWQFLPRDKDLSFGSHTRLGQTANDYFSYEYGVVGGFDNALVGKFLDTPELRAQLHARIAYGVDEVFTPARIRPRVETIGAAIADNMDVRPSATAFVRQSAQHHGLQGVHVLHRENLVDFVELRRAFLDRLLRPVPGGPYAAEADLTGAAPGDRVLFTDPTGWTVGSLTVTSAEAAGVVRLSVEPGPQVGVDRVYRLDNASGTVSGRLSLHFRNEVEGPAGTPTVNWYRTSEAVGGQFGLAVVADGVRLPSAANPYSDKVSADVTLPAGPHTFVLAET